MSEGQHAPASTLTEQLRPTDRDVDLLHQIVSRAQNNPLASAKESLFAAYDAIFQEEGLDVLQDRVSFGVLLKILDPAASGSTLYEKFETVLESEGIELAFDDDPSTRSPFRHSNQSSISLPTGKVPSSRPEIARRNTEHYPSTAASSRVRSDSGGPEPARRDGSVDIRSPSASSAVQPESDQRLLNRKVLDEQLEHPPPHMSRLMQTAVAMDRKTLVKSVLTQLHSQQLAAMKTTADKLYEYKLKFRATSHWWNVARQINANWSYANDLDVRGKKLQALQKMLDAARVNRLRAMEEERLRGMGLYKMTIASRESFFHRNKDSKLKRRYLSTIANAFRATSAHRQELDSMLRNFGPHLDARILQPTINRLLHISTERGNIDTSANNHYLNKVGAKAIDVWSNKTHFAIEMVKLAEDARKLFLMRKYLFRMRDIARARRNRRTVLGKWVLIRWQAHVKERKHDHYDAAYKTMRRKLKMNLARRCLQDMATRSVGIKALEQMAVQQADLTNRSHAHRIVVVWYNQSQQAIQLENLAVQHSNDLALRRATETLSQKRLHVNQLRHVADGYQDLHLQRVATTCLKTMGRKVFEVRRRQQDADVSRTRHDRQRIRSQLDQWRRKVAENRGEGPLVLPPATPAQRRADQLNRLASTTPQFAPRTSFAARLREEGSRNIQTEERDDEDGVEENEEELEGRG